MHKTTKIDGKWVKRPNHIIANFHDSKNFQKNQEYICIYAKPMTCVQVKLKEGGAAHVYLGDDDTEMVKLSTEKPNPKVTLRPDLYLNGKGRSSLVQLSWNQATSRFTLSDLGSIRLP